MKAENKTSRRGGARKPKRLWTKKMEREYQARWQIEAIRNAIGEVISAPVNYEDIPLHSPQELKEMAAKMSKAKPQQRKR